MDIRDSLATLQLLNTRVPELTIENDFVTLPSKEETETSLELGDVGHAIEKRDDVYIGVLQLKIHSITKSKNSDKKIEFSIVVEGIFKFDSDDKNLFEQMLFINGNSSLYSIARSHIINITSLSLASGQIILPMLNIVKIAKLNNLGEAKVSE